MARALPHHQIRDYMYITCYGLTLFSIGITATVSGAGYPPFGLPTVSLVGPFSFLLLESLVWTTRIIRWVLDKLLTDDSRLGVANGRLESEDFKKFENMMHDKIQELEIEPEDSDTTREKEVLRDEIDTFKCVLGHLFNLKSDGDEAQTIRIRETNSKFQQTDHERKQLIKTEINAQIQRS